jgi:hypothetical protein
MSARGVKRRGDPFVVNEMKPCCEQSEANPYEMATLPLVTRHDSVTLLNAFTLESVS